MAANATYIPFGTGMIFINRLLVKDRCSAERAVPDTTAKNGYLFSRAAQPVTVTQS
jgi:hypothetical protein